MSKSEYSNWFPHMIGSLNDPKLQEIMMKHGLQGIGAYWCLVEVMYQFGGKLPIKDVDKFAYIMRMDANALHELIKCSAFEKDNDQFWTSGVLKRMEKRAGISEVRTLAANEKHRIDRENKAKAMQMHANDEQMHAIKKERKKERKNNSLFIIPTIEEIDAYCKEKGYDIDAAGYFEYNERKNWILPDGTKMQKWKSDINLLVIRLKNKKDKTKSGIDLFLKEDIKC